MRIKARVAAVASVLLGACLPASFAWVCGSPSYPVALFDSVWTLLPGNGIAPNTQVVIINKAQYAGFAPQLCFHVNGNLQPWSEVAVGGTPCSAVVHRNQIGCDGPYLDAAGCCIEGVPDGLYILTATILSFASGTSGSSQTTDQLVAIVEPVSGGSCQSPNDLLDCPVQCGQSGGCQTCEACVQCCLAFSDQEKCSRFCEPSCHPGVEAAPQANFIVDDASAGFDPAVTGRSPNHVHADAGTARQQVTAYVSSGTAAGIPPDGTNARVPALVGAIGSPSPPQFASGDKINSLSSGRDGTMQGGVAGDGTLYFSVSRESIGAACTAVWFNSMVVETPEQAADLYASGVDPFGRYSTPPSFQPPLSGNVLVAQSTDLGLRPERRQSEQDDVTGLDLTPGMPNGSVYLAFAGPSFMADAATIYRYDTSAGSFDLAHLSAFSHASDLGLIAGDIIDALVLSEITPPAIPEPNGVMNAGSDELLFSLAPGSPTLAAQGLSAADVLYSGFDGSFVLFAGHERLGLLTSDNIDALALTGNSSGADLDLQKVSGPGPVPAGSEVTYTVTVRNDGPNAAMNATLADPTPDHTVLRSIDPPPGWACTTPRKGTGAIVCSTPRLEPNASAIFSIVLKVEPCTGDGTTITELGTVSSSTYDPNAANNQASAVNTVSNTGVCDDGNACTAGDTCHGGNCLGTPVVCGDDNPCTDESCDPATGCVVVNHCTTCADPTPLTLNVTTKGSSVGAGNNSQSSATTTCFPGPGNTPTNSPGRDIVFSFTAPPAPNPEGYSFRIVQQRPGDVIANQNPVLHASTTCPPTDCIQGANHAQSASFVSSTGASNNQSEELTCIPLAPNQTIYVFFDDAAAGNAGGAMSIEPIECRREAEPNGTPATANPYVCGMLGSSDAAPVAHCRLGDRAGNVCTRSLPLSQSAPDSDMRCSISGLPCIANPVTGGDDCSPGGGVCQQHTDLDCDPRCDIGSRAGKSCTTQAFCNPGSDEGATCAGTCQVESTCVITATGADTGTACVPVCVGSSIPSVNGRYCSALSGCPGAGVCNTTPLVPFPGATCVAGQTCSRGYNEGDTDFYSVGSPPVGSKIFAGIDAKSANDNDFRMRINTGTNTLAFDDDDVTSRGGAAAPTIAGAVADGTPAYIQVSRTSARQSAPYELYAIVRGPLAEAQSEDESGPTGNDIHFGWPGDVVNANYATSGGYVKGSFQFQGDSDCFKFLVEKGDLMDWFGDGNPNRAAGSVLFVNIPQPIIYDAEPAGISNLIFAANPRKNTSPNVQGAGLRALSPATTSSYFQWRASYTGMLEVCFYDASAALGQGTLAYPSAWAGSLSVNCGPLRPAGPGTTTADVELTQSGPAGPVQAGAFAIYTITVTNGSVDIAQEVRLHDVLDPNVSFVSLVVDDGFSGLGNIPRGTDVTGTYVSNNTACINHDHSVGLPTAGANDRAIDCITTSLAPGATATYTLTVQVANCLDAGVTISNDPTITTVSTDPDTSDNSSPWSFTTSADGPCVVLSCSTTGCTPDNCRADAHCEAGACVSNIRNCDDGNTCNGDEACEPASGCVAGTPLSCKDGDACTSDNCNPASGCVFESITAPPETLNVMVAADKATYSWSAATYATQYDVVRGGLGGFPVGAGGELCFENLAGPILVDATAPAIGTGFWYLSRGANTCGNGTYGTQGVHGAPGAPRVTTTCP